MLLVTKSSVSTEQKQKHKASQTSSSTLTPQIMESERAVFLVTLTLPDGSS